MIEKGDELRGLVLSGGGARGAYQAGTLAGVFDIAHSAGIENPFKILTGSSAGAINASYLAAHAGNMRGCTRRLGQFWSSLHSGGIFEVGAMAVAKKSVKVCYDLFAGSLKDEATARSLLDNDPLRKLLEQSMPFHKLEANIKKGTLHGLAVKAVNYTTGGSHTFFQGHKDIEPWLRARRESERSKITIKHLMASTAIPVLFPAVKIGNHYFGDGSLRNYTPLSPAIKMGAKKVMVVGVRCDFKNEKVKFTARPSFARMSGMILNSIMMDNIDLDYERSLRINKTILNLKKTVKSDLNPVDVFLLRPSQDIGALALEKFDKMPKTIRFLIGGLGTKEEAADLISNLLFEPSFTEQLSEMGYEDAYERKSEIVQFLGA